MTAYFQLLTRAVRAISFLDLYCTQTSPVTIVNKAPVREPKHRLLLFNLCFFGWCPLFCATNVLTTPASGSSKMARHFERQQTLTFARCSQPWPRSNIDEHRHPHVEACRFPVRSWSPWMNAKMEKPDNLLCQRCFIRSVR